MAARRGAESERLKVESGALCELSACWLSDKHSAQLMMAYQISILFKQPLGQIHRVASADLWLNPVRLLKDLLKELRGVDAICCRVFLRPPHHSGNNVRTSCKQT